MFFNEIGKKHVSVWKLNIKDRYLGVITPYHQRRAVRSHFKDRLHVPEHLLSTLELLHKFRGLKQNVPYPTRSGKSLSVFMTAQTYVRDD